MTSPPPREVELRLEIDASQAEHLLALPSLRELVDDYVTRRQLRSVYYDTRGLDLDRGGFVLRMREDECGWIQTLTAKGGSTAGLFDRPEIEWRVTGPEPDTTLLAHAGCEWAADAEKLRNGEALAPAIETHVQRTTVPIAWRGSEIEMAIDVGHIQARDHRVPICEVEFELKSGDVTALHDVALDLSEPPRDRPGICHSVPTRTLTGNAAVEQPGAVAHPGPSPDPDKEISTIRLLR